MPFSTTLPSLRDPAEHYSQIKHLSALLDAGIKFVVHGYDALNIIYRTPMRYACVPIPQHILVPDDAVDNAAYVLSSTHGYTTHNDHPFPTTVTLRHPDPKYNGAMCILIHPSSTFHFDLDDPSRTITDPHPPNPSLAAILFPSEIAFLDSATDVFFDHPVGIRASRIMYPYETWLYDMFRYGLSRYPNEWEKLILEDDELEDDEDSASEDDDEDREPKWQQGTRCCNGEEISVLEYVSREAKEENRHYLLKEINPSAPQVPEIPWCEVVRMRSEIKAKRTKSLDVANLRVLQDSALV